MEELRGAIASMPPNSAPGVGGLTAGFYATFLDTLGDSLLAMITLVLEEQAIPASFGAGPVVLILKEGAPPNTIGNIEIASTVKVLGIFYTCEGVAATTWSRALDMALQLTERARLLDLTLREKALAVKTCICALASNASRVSAMTARTASQLTKLTNSLLWDGKPPPVKRNILQLAVTEGGLGLPHVLNTSRVLALKTARTLAQARDFVRRGLLLYWSSVRNDWLGVDRHPGPFAESPAPFYKTASATMRMLSKEVPNCEVDADPPASIVEALTWHQLSEEDKQKAKHAKRELQPRSAAAPTAKHRTFS
ncbi:hypothetical protein HPB52_009053 [Rhipicephalus sanguineus]|uniref:Uncharacterized protein n=1 Tax=Rhipicephalus sanguineus TaxID=34632 RepID=A0A9D4PZZ7_RHISA|nr:hypothetical protein HPB52_009053 [Rhipicephalus sanguineus]